MLFTFFVLTIFTKTSFCQDKISDPEILNIGVIHSLTGIAAEDGKTAVQGLELAAKEINAQAGPKVKLFIEDDGSDSKRSVSAYKKLLQQKPLAIIGPTWSFTFNSVVPFAAQDKMVLLNSSTIPECLFLEQSKGFAYTTATRVSEHAKAFDLFLSSDSSKSVVIFYTNNSWGEAQRIKYKEVLTKRNIKIINEYESSNFDLSEWSVLLPKAKALNGDLWLLLLNKSDLETILRRAREIKVQSRFFASYHVADLLRVHNDLDLFEDVCFPYPAPLPKDNPPFISKFRHTYHEDPKIFAETSYDTLFLILEAFKLSKQNTTSLNDSLPLTSRKGVAGNYSYSQENSFSTGTAHLMCIRDGKVRPEN